LVFFRVEQHLGARCAAEEVRRVYIGARPRGHLGSHGSDLGCGSRISSSSRGGTALRCLRSLLPGHQD
jgi:hypothetical protein